MEIEKIKRNRTTSSIVGKSFYKILEGFPLYLTQTTDISLNEVFEVGIHEPTNSLYICNKGASLHTKTPTSQKDYITYHMRFGIFIPNHGLEIVNLGIVGNLDESKSIVMRPESACAPSFLFGSQRCNCHDQWILSRELAGYYNEFKVPDLKGKDLEIYIRKQFDINKNGIPTSKNNSQAFLLIHMDSQNGMGSGVIDDKFNGSLTSTAFLRHGGEYTIEQKYLTSMAEGFTGLGIPLDPRRLNNAAGYNVPVIILDYLGIEKPIIALTNNNEKVEELKKAGYSVDRLSLFARADNSCYSETKDRRAEFGHEIPIGLETNIEKEFSRLTQELDWRI